MHRALYIFFVLLFIFSFAITAYSKNEMTICNVEPIFTKQSDIISIPIKINGNNGLMGFKFSVEYDPNIFENPKVQKGQAIKEGMFSDSISENTSGQFFVLWTGTENFMDDGELFYISISVKKNAQVGKSIIKIENSSEDTFNENWGNINLICNPVEIVVGEIDNTKTRYNDAVSNNSYDIISDFAEQTIKNNIIQIVNNALKSIGAKDIYDIPKDKQSEFVEIVDKNIDESSADTFKNEESVESRIESIKEMYEKASDSESITTTEIIQQQNNNIWSSKNKILIVILALVIMAAMLAIFITKKRR